MKVLEKLRSVMRRFGSFIAAGAAARPMTFGIVVAIVLFIVALALYRWWM